MSKKNKKKDLFEVQGGKNPFGDETDDSTIFDVDTSVKHKRKKHRKKSKRSENPFEVKPKATKSRAKSWWPAPLAACCILILGFIALYCVNAAVDYEQFKAEKASVQSETFYDGVVVENYDVSGKTLAEALEYWDKWIEAPLRETSIVFETGDTARCVNCEELGYTSDYETALLNAWSDGRSGSFEERYRSLKQIRTAKARTTVTRTLYDEELLREYTDRIAEEFTTDAVNAEILNFNFDTHEFTLGESSNGSYVDADALYEQAKAMLDNGGGRLVVDIQTVEPEVKTTDLEGKFGMITQALTNASSSNSNRVTNLKLACAAINGTIVMPGETFSYNDTVGERTKAKGYKVATVYQSGEVSEDIGGGVCQVSTTLWNAAMKADCEIVERHEHSRPVSYVDKGKDATVSWTSQDMKFKNTSDYPMYIVAYVSSDKRVYCEIYGRLFDDGMYITIEAKTTETIKPGDPTYVLNPALAAGKTVTVSEARTGYKAKAYRVYHAADGTELSRVLLCTSYYKEAAAKIEYGE